VSRNLRLLPATLTLLSELEESDLSPIVGDLERAIVRGG